MPSRGLQLLKPVEARELTHPSSELCQGWLWQSGIIYLSIERKNMDSGMGTIIGARPPYEELIEQAQKGLSEMTTALGNLENKLAAVMANEAPGPISAKSNAPTERLRVVACKLEDSLTQICNQIEGRLVTIQNINTRIRL